MNETQLWSSDICDRAVHFQSNSKRFNSKTHIHRKKTKWCRCQKNKNIKSKIDEVECIFVDVIKDCRDMFFHIFES